MLEIKNKEDCCGCEACTNICPSKCISMVQDKEGFFYPHIDLENCIKCGACEQVCPERNYKPEYWIMKAYAVQTRDRNVLEKSASGGGYSSLARWVVAHGGVAVGATFKDGIVKHTCVSQNSQEVLSHSSSKYVQSRIENIYSVVKNILRNEPDRWILFSGTPCQVAALKLFLGKEYPQLYTVDLVCAGVSSPKVFDMYIAEMQKKFASKILNLNFKKKMYGYHSSTMALWFNNEKTYSRSRLTDPMMHVFTAHIADRPSCATCVAKGRKRYSDITLFDCWHYSELTGNVDNDLGHSNLLIHTQKGEDLLFQCENLLDIEEINAEKAILLDGNMVSGRQKHNQNREMFFEELNLSGLDAAIKKYVPITFVDYLKEFSKKHLYGLGILEKIKKLEKR